MLRSFVEPSLFPAHPRGTPPREAHRQGHRIRGLVLLGTVLSAPTVLQSQPAAVHPDALDSGLVAWYPFDGNARDASGNENHGTIDGLEPCVDRNGSPSSALRFVRRNGFVELPYSSDFSFSDFHAVSIGLWFRPLPDMGKRGLSFGLRNAGTICRYFCFSFGVKDTMAFGSIFASECVIMVERPMRAAGVRWHHLLATVDDEFLVLYLDGECAGRRAVYDMKWDSPRMVKPRLDWHTPSSTPEGMAVDDLRVYRRVLSPQEVPALYKKETK